MDVTEEKAWKRQMQEWEMSQKKVYDGCGALRVIYWYIAFFSGLPGSVIVTSICSVFVQLRPSEGQQSAYAGHAFFFCSSVTVKGFDSGIWNPKRLINKQDTANFMWDNWQIERQQHWLNTDGEKETQTNAIRLSLSVVLVRWTKRCIGAILPL